MVASDFQDVLKTLFSDAENNGGLDYIFTLLRVTGITRTKDPLIELESILKDQYLTFPVEDPTVRSCLFIGIEESLNILGNLLNCNVGQAYKHCFFRSLYKGSFPNIVKPSIDQMLKEVQNRATQNNNPEIVDLIDHSSLAILFDKESSRSTDHQVSPKLFLQTLIGVYKSERLKFKDRSRFCKLPRFEVLELMVDEVDGLYGFYLHFSNGSSTHFMRLADSTESLNLSFDRESELVPFVGDFDALTEEWRVGKKRLYEIGLPGHYNKLGEWKPIIYPGKSDSLQRDAQKISDDPEVQGILFYMMCTGHRVFEFVMKATLDIPLECFTIGNNIHFWKCPPKDGFNFNNTVIYDGWIELEHIEPEYIRAVIDQIGIVINRLAFAYDADVTWCPKYKMTRSIGSCASPKEEDLGIINSLLEEFPQTEDANILLSAIDWYNKGRSSSNIFTSFLCYYIAMESVANAIVEGDAHLGIDFYKDAPKKRKENRIKCIQAKHSELYQDNPIEFVTQSYFDCVVGLKKRTQQVIEKVFGKDHEYTKLLFEKIVPDCKPLSDIRSEIAHGKINFHSKEDRKLVQKNLHKVKCICKNFLTRLIFSLKPDDSLPAWSGIHSSSMPTNDPRAFLVISDEKIIPNPDWKIKAEWCEN